MFDWKLELNGHIFSHIFYSHDSKRRELNLKGPTRPVCVLTYRFVPVSPAWFKIRGASYIQYIENQIPAHSLLYSESIIRLSLKSINRWKIYLIKSPWYGKSFFSSTAYNHFFLFRQEILCFQRMSLYSLRHNNGQMWLSSFDGHAIEPMTFDSNCGSSTLWSTKLTHQDKPTAIV